MKNQKFTKRSLINEIISLGQTAKNNIVENFTDEIYEFIDQIYEIYELHLSLTQKWKEKYNENDERCFWVDRYIFYAINNLICSTSILIGGYLVPSGNLVRQFYESMAMATILSSHDIDYFDNLVRIFKTIIKLVKRKEKYSKKKNEAMVKETRTKIDYFLRKIDVTQAFTWENNNLVTLGINEEDWREQLQLKNYYHRFSHAAVNALASIFDKSLGKGKIWLGSRDDDAMMQFYEIELKRRIFFAVTLKERIKLISQILLKD